MKFNECEQFKGWSFDDLKESIYYDFEYGDNLKDFYEEAKGHEKDAIVIKLPEPVKREYAKPGTDEVFSIEFPAMSLVKLPNGQELSILTRFDENNRPVFGVSEEILQMFVEKELSEEAHK